MADDVQITIGVALEKLQAGLLSAQSQLESFKSTVTTLLAAGGLVAFVDKMAELGEQAERSAAILGISTVAAQELGVIAQVSGGSLEGITTQLTRLQVGLERGEKSTSLQAAALNALGVNAKQFLATPVDKQINLFADAVKRLSDEGKNAAPALALISRGLAQMMPELELGSAGMDALRQRSVEVGAVVSTETTKALGELHTQLILLWDSLKGLGETIVASLSPAFISLASSISEAAGKLSALIATGTLGTYLWAALKLEVQLLSAEFLNDVEAIDEVKRHMDALDDTINTTIKKYQDMVAAAASAASKLPVTVKMPGADAAAVKEADEAFKKLSEMYKFQAETFQISETQKTQYLVDALKQREIAEIKAGEDSRVATAKYEADYIKAINEMNLATFKAFKSMADTIATDFSTAFNSVLNGTKTWSEAMATMVRSMIERMVADVIKLIVEFAVLKAASAFLPQIGVQSFGALATGVFPVLGALGGGGAQAAALTANTGALGVLTSAITAHATVVSVGTGATVAHTTATATQTAATGVQTAATFEGAAVTTLHTAVVTPNTVATVANTFATELNTIKGFFPGFAQGAWNIPSYDVGVQSQPFTGLAILHPGEMVIPAGPAQQIRDGTASAGGGMSVQFNVSTMDAQSFGSWLRGGGGNQIANYVSRALQSNPSLRPGYTA